jgi:hypothetical protein
MHEAGADTFTGMAIGVLPHLSWRRGDRASSLTRGLISRCVVVKFGGLFRAAISRNATTMRAKLDSGQNRTLVGLLGVTLGKSCRRADRGPCGDKRHALRPQLPDVRRGLNG